MINIVKGWFGEKAAQFSIWLTLDDTTYRPFHNLILKVHNRTTQIDHVVVSPYGLFVIETKNYKGWIYGSEDQKQWTQSLYGEKHSFQNPLRQNHLHTLALAEVLKVDIRKIHSVVYFIGQAELKTALPANVITGGLSFYIQGFQEIVFNADELQRIELELTRRVQERISTREHLHNLNERHSSDLTCPQCGNLLVNRMARKGSSAGTEFLGCSSYPKCKYTR